MATSDLQTTVRECDGTTVVDLRGEIDRSADEALAQAYGEATRGGSQSVVLNFERVDYINSTGIALIVGLLARARAQKVHLSACGLSAHYREIFEITRLADFLAINPDEESAVRGVERSNT